MNHLNFLKPAVTVNYLYINLSRWRHHFHYRVYWSDQYDTQAGSSHQPRLSV